MSPEETATLEAIRGLEVRLYGRGGTDRGDITEIKEIQELIRARWHETANEIQKIGLSAEELSRDLINLRKEHDERKLNCYQVNNPPSQSSKLILTALGSSTGTGLILLLILILLKKWGLF